jgi:phosphatidylglycerophosphatase A
MKNTVPAEKRVKVAVDLRDPAHFIAFGFGSGLAPVAPGTFGTLAAVPLYVLLAMTLSPAGYLLVFVLVTALGTWAAQVSSRKLGVHDHSGIVIDEIAGYLLTLLPFAFSWQAALAGFLLFRLFDIAKPWPIRVLDARVHGGVGIMADDLLAAFYAAVCLGLLAAFVPQAGIAFIAP